MDTGIVMGELAAMRQEVRSADRETREMLTRHALDDRAEFQQIRKGHAQLSQQIERGVGALIAIRWLMLIIAAAEAFLHSVEALRR